ncbi:MAG: CvpA family protein [Hyphomicrobiaceae bacterium]
MIGPLTYLDAGLIAIAVLSGLLAMYRGLTREVLSILSWLIAGGAVIYFVLFQKPLAEDLAQTIGTKVPIAQIAIGGIIFLIVLVIIHLITSRISDSILDSRVGMIDRMFGLIFGVARGFLLVVIPYMFLFGFLAPNYAEEQPWVRDAYSKPYIESTGNALRGFLERIMPEDFNLDAPGGGTESS